MRFNVHNGEGPHPHPDVVSPAFLEALTSRNRTFRHPNWPKNDLRELLSELYTDREELAQSRQFETTQPQEESRKIIITVVPNSRMTISGLYL